MNFQGIKNVVVIPPLVPELDRYVPGMLRVGRPDHGEQSVKLRKVAAFQAWGKLNEQATFLITDAGNCFHELRNMGGIEIQFFDMSKLSKKLECKPKGCRDRI